MRKSHAEQLAGQAHHNLDVRNKNAKGLIRWFVKKADRPTDDEVLRFLEFFREFEKPTMKMDQVFREAAELIKSGNIDQIIGKGWRHREEVVASVAYVMSLYRGESAKFSFSDRMIEKYFGIEELRLSHTTANVAVKDLVEAGILKTVQAHEIILRGGGMMFCSRMFQWLGPRPFDDIDKKIADLKRELSLKMTNSNSVASEALVLPQIDLESSDPPAETSTIAFLRLMYQDLARCVYDFMSHQGGDL